MDELTAGQKELAKWLCYLSAEGKIKEQFTVSWETSNGIPENGEIENLDIKQTPYPFSAYFALENMQMILKVNAVIIKGKKGGVKNGVYLFEIPTRETKRTYVILNKLLDYSSPGKINEAKDDSPTMVSQENDFISTELIYQLRMKKSSAFDFSRLVRYCEEINMNWRSRNFLAVIFESRAILDHCPPIFNEPNFESVTSHVNGTSFRKTTSRLNTSLKNIADQHIHKQIGTKEVLPTKEEVDFSQDLNRLISKIIEIA